MLKQQEKLIKKHSSIHNMNFGDKEHSKRIGKIIGFLISYGISVTILSLLMYWRVGANMRKNIFYIIGALGAIILVGYVLKRNYYD